MTWKKVCDLPLLAAQLSYCGGWADKLEDGSGSDRATFSRLFGKARAGIVWANTHNKFDLTSSFSGYQESGFDREGQPAWPICLP